MSQTRCELLTLSIDDLNKMQHEFQEPYDNLFESAYTRLLKCLKIKLKAIMYCNHNLWKDKLKCILPSIGVKNDTDQGKDVPSDFHPIDMV